jgi:hypothetical protein
MKQYILLLLSLIALQGARAQTFKRDFVKQPIIVTYHVAKEKQFLSQAHRKGLTQQDSGTAAISQYPGYTKYVIKPGQFSPVITEHNTKINENVFSAVTQTTSGTLSTLNCASANCGALPAELLELSGKRLNEEVVKLNWKTINESDVQGFDIERSFNSTTGFIKVGYTAALATLSWQKYYTSNDPNNFGGISYYRLKQKDLNADISYSNVISIKGSAKAESLVLFPNPAVDKIQIKLSAQQAGPALFKITDIAGRLLTVTTRKLSTGENYFTDNVLAYAPGTYILLVYRESLPVMPAKFVKN